MTGPAVRRAAAQLDRPDPRRVGVVLFDEDVTTEAALSRMARDEAVEVHYARMPVPLGATAPVLEKAARDLEAAAALLAPSTPFAALAYSCTTNTLELGVDRVREAFARSRPGVPVATPITGAVGALQALGVRRAAVVTPYNDVQNSLILDHLQASDLEVSGLTVLDVPNEVDFIRVSPDSIRAAARDVIDGDAEALLISCVALRATNLVRELEAEFGRPVVTSAQAMWWEALTLAGLRRRRADIGRLFAL